MEVLNILILGTYLFIAGGSTTVTQLLNLEDPNTIPDCLKTGKKLNHRFSDLIHFVKLLF
jgi:hypothetical protein